MHLFDRKVLFYSSSCGFISRYFDHFAILARRGTRVEKSLRDKEKYKKWKHIVCNWKSCLIGHTDVSWLWRWKIVTSFVSTTVKRNPWQNNALSHILSVSEKEGCAIRFRHFSQCRRCSISNDAPAQNPSAEKRGFLLRHDFDGKDKKQQNHVSEYSRGGRKSIFLQNAFPCIFNDEIQKFAEFWWKMRCVHPHRADGES